MDSDSSESDEESLNSESNDNNIPSDSLSSESNDEYITFDAKIYKQMIDLQRAGDKHSNFDNPESNTYPDAWLIFTSIMLLMSYVVFSLKTRGLSGTDLPVLSLTVIMMFITGK